MSPLNKTKIPLPFSFFQGEGARRADEVNRPHHRMTTQSPSNAPLNHLLTLVSKSPLLGEGI